MTRRRGASGLGLRASGHALLLFGLAACTGGEPEEVPSALEDWSADLQRTAVSVDVGAREAEAAITFGVPSGGGLSFEAAGLSVTDVWADDDRELDWDHDGEALHVGVPDGVSTVRVAYTYEEVRGFSGVNEDGFTLTWPDFCGNVFPCRSHPRDGLVLDLEVTGVPSGQTAVYAPSTVGQAPAYQLAWAVGDFAWTELGTTPGGTTLGVWIKPQYADRASQGTAGLVDGFAWMESTLGPYPFGDTAGSVGVYWGPAGGGMEHHPLWFVSEYDAANPVLHFHEAAHGWFGGGIRLNCWEDFVLSEGLATYLAARAVGITDGSVAEEAVWADYDQTLQSEVATNDAIAWPDSCDVVDIDDIYSWIPYMKGAFFLREVEQQVGRAALDDALGVFFRARVGTAAGFQDLLDTIADETGHDASARATLWLRQTGIPQ